MKGYLIGLLLLAAGAATATPLPSREKPNILGFHQHLPKSSLHASATGEAVIPAVGPGRISPAPDKTSDPSAGPGGTAATPGKTPSQGPGCTTQSIGTSDPAVPWGCAATGPLGTIPETPTPALLAIGLAALWWVRRLTSRKLEPSPRIGRTS